jgi:hypothetical protein
LSRQRLGESCGQKSSSLHDGIYGIAALLTVCAVRFAVV